MTLFASYLVQVKQALAAKPLRRDFDTMPQAVHAMQHVKDGYYLNECPEFCATLIARAHDRWATHCLTGHMNR